MRILILGASSSVGAALAEAFARDNDLILTGRNVCKLVIVADKCRNAGAAQVGYIEQDLCLGISAVLEASSGKQIDLIIDAASASSSRRDAEIASSEISDYVSADFLSRTEIMDHLLGSQDRAPAMIFISTVLTLVKSPGRAVYTALKALYETYLVKIKNNRPDFNLLIAHVGTVIDTRHDTNKAKKLALAVRTAFDNKQGKLFFGLSGIILVGLFYFQPMLFYGFTVTQRKIRQLLA